MKTDPAAFIFSPRQSERERREAMHEERTTPMNCGNRPGTNRVQNPKRWVGDCWSPETYARAILRACGEAFSPPEHLQRRRVPADGHKHERWETTGEWRKRLKTGGLLHELDQWRKDHRWCPSRLRHSCATRVRAAHGLEAAQVYLGHAKADVTQIYAERDMRRASWWHGWSAGAMIFKATDLGTRRRRLLPGLSMDAPWPTTHHMNIYSLMRWITFTRTSKAGATLS